MGKERWKEERRKVGGELRWCSGFPLQSLPFSFSLSSYRDVWLVFFTLFSSFVGAGPFNFRVLESRIGAAPAKRTPERLEWAVRKQTDPGTSRGSLKLTVLFVLSLVRFLNKKKKDNTRGTSARRRYEVVSQTLRPLPQRAARRENNKLWFYVPKSRCGYEARRNG